MMERMEQMNRILLATSALCIIIAPRVTGLRAVANVMPR